MHSRRNWWPAVPTAVVIVLGAFPLGAAAGSSAHRFVTVNHRPPVKSRVFQEAVTSTADKSEIGTDWTVFSRHVMSLRPETPQTDPLQPLVAVADNRHRTTHTFGYSTPDMQAFSASGHYVTAGGIGSGDAYRLNHVYWWAHPFTHSKSTSPHYVTLPDGYRYLSSAPDGWIETNAQDVLYDVNAKSGKSRRLAQPFHDLDANHLAASSGPSGIVVDSTDSHKVAFVTFHNGHVTRLSNAAIPSNEGDHTFWPVCSSVSATATACAVYGTNEDGDDTTTPSVFVVPLNGKAPIISKPVPHLCITAPGVRGNTGAWTSCDGRVVIGTAKHVRHTKTFLTYSDAPIPGFGGFTVTSKSGHSIIAVSPHLKQSTLLRSQSTKAEAGALSLDGKTVAWTQNNTGNPTNLAVLSRSLHVRHHRVVTGPIRTVSKNHATGYVGVAGSTIAYGAKGEKVIVKGKGFHRVLSGIHRRKDQVSLSQHWLAYTSVSKPSVGTVVNLKTGESTKLAAHSFAISGVHLAYTVSADNGLENIEEENLATGVTQTVADGVEPQAQDAAVKLFAHDTVVGWDDYKEAEDKLRWFWRDTSTDAPPTELPVKRALVGLSDAGVVEEKLPPKGPFNDPRQFYYGGLNDFQETAVFKAVGYIHGNSAVPTDDFYIQSIPQVANGIDVWIDAFGRLRATAIG